MSEAQYSRRSLFKAAAVAGLAASVPSTPRAWLASNRPSSYAVQPWMLVPRDLGSRTNAREDSRTALDAAQNHLFGVNQQKYRFNSVEPTSLDVDFTFSELESMAGFEIYIALSDAVNQERQRCRLDGPGLKHLALLPGEIDPPLQSHPNGGMGAIIGGARSGLPIATVLLNPQGIPELTRPFTPVDAGKVAVHEMAHLFGAQHWSPPDPQFPQYMEATAVSRESRWMAAPERQQVLLDRALTPDAVYRLGV